MTPLFAAARIRLGRAPHVALVPRPLIALLLSVSMMLGLSACMTAREVREAVADGNAAALAIGADSAITKPKNLDQSLSQLEAAIALPNVTPATVASLRMRQALLCLIAGERATAAAYRDKVIVSDLRSRERKVHEAWDEILLDQELAQQGLTDQTRQEARDGVEHLVRLMGSDLDDVDHCLAHYAVALATHLANSGVDWDRSQGPTRRAATALYERFGDERSAALTAILASGDSYKDELAKLSRATAIRVDAARGRFSSLQKAMLDNDLVLSAGDGIPESLLRYLNRQ